MHSGITSITIFLLVGVAMAAVPIAVSFLLWRKPSKAIYYKLKAISSEFEPYESGMPAEGSGRAVGFEYLIYAILFLLFDVIALLFFLAAVALKYDRSEFLMPFVLLAAFALLIIAYGAKKREYLKI